MGCRGRLSYKETVGSNGYMLNNSIKKKQKINILDTLQGLLDGCVDACDICTAYFFIKQIT